MKEVNPNGTRKGNFPHWFYLSIALALLVLVSTSVAAPFAYVTNVGCGTVSVIDTATNTVAATVPAGPSPYGVDITPDGTKAYITNIGSNAVSVIDTATNTVAATVSVGLGPTGVAVTSDGTKAYVTNAVSNTVSVIDTATNAIMANIPAGSNPASFGKFIGPAPQASNISIIKTATADSVEPGDNVTYIINVTNTGMVQLTTVRVVDKLPIGLVYVSDNSTSPGVASGNLITWNNGGPWPPVPPSS